jgi:hypothetical protein
MPHKCALPRIGGWLVTEKGEDWVISQSREYVGVISLGSLGLKGDSRKAWKGVLGKEGWKLEGFGWEEKARGSRNVRVICKSEFAENKEIGDSECVGYWYR